MSDRLVVVREAGDRIVITGATPSTAVQVTESDRIVVTSTGPPGPAGRDGIDGLPGPTGPPGPAGADGDGNVAFFMHVQETPTATWLVTHAMGFNPNISIVDTSDTVVEGDIQHIDSNSVVISFSTPFAGKAYFS